MRGACQATAAQSTASALTIQAKDRLSDAPQRDMRDRPAVSSHDLKKDRTSDNFTRKELPISLYTKPVDFVLNLA